MHFFFFRLYPQMIASAIYVSIKIFDKNVFVISLDVFEINQNIMLHYTFLSSDIIIVSFAILESNSNILQGEGVYSQNF